MGYADAAILETLTYSVIGTTVVLQGLSSPFVARRLGLERRSRATWLLIGDPWIAMRLHRTLRQCGAPTLVFATAGVAGEDGVTEDPLEPESITDPRVADAEAVLAVSGDPEMNDRICSAWSDVVGSAACYRWDSPDVGPRVAGRALWPDAPGPAEVRARTEAGTLAIDAVEVGTSHDTTRFGPALRPLLGVDEGHISIIADEAPADVQSMLVLRQRIQGLGGLMRDALILDKQNVSFEEVLEALLDVAARSVPDLEVKTSLAEILEREHSMPTAIGAGVCIPHFYHGSAAQSMAFLALVPSGLAAQGHEVQGHQVQGHEVQGHEVQGHDGEPVRLVFLVISPADHATAHLTSLSAIAQLARDRGLLNTLLHQRTRGRLLTLLRERE